MQILMLYQLGHLHPFIESYMLTQWVLAIHGSMIRFRIAYRTNSLTLYLKFPHDVGAVCFDGFNADT
jgi:hypothetical protein